MSKVGFIKNNKWITFNIMFVILYFSYIPFRKNISAGDIIIKEGELLANGIAYILFFNSTILLIGFLVFLYGLAIGKVICRTWGLISSMTLAVGIYHIYGPYNPVYLTSVLIWSLVWFFGLKKPMNHVV